MLNILKMVVIKIIKIKMLNIGFKFSKLLTEFEKFEKFLRNGIRKICSELLIKEINGINALNRKISDKPVKIIRKESRKI